MQNPNHLIIVAGHAAFKAAIKSCPDDPAKDEHWVLQPFQHGEPPYYIEHIQKGAELLAQDPSSLLLFSGGRTRQAAGHWSEAASYKAVAEHFNYWNDHPQQLVARVALEQYARDSLQNIEYSLYRFYQLTGRYPSHISVVGWQFKAQRFDLHRQALGISAAAFSYIGVNNPADVAGAEEGEAQALAHFRADPLGNYPPLADKRAQRNPFNEVNSYKVCPPINLQNN